MAPLSKGLLFQFKQLPAEPGRAGAGSRADEKVGPKEPRGQLPIVCRACHHVITLPAERISMQGLHEHTFANPYGLVFQIGCFRSAVGCVHMGDLRGEFTWFSGFNWRVALCINCQVNLGWLFASPAGQRFHGLILNRLTFPGG